MGSAAGCCAWKGRLDHDPALWGGLMEADPGGSPDSVPRQNSEPCEERRGKTKTEVKQTFHSLFFMDKIGILVEP